MDDQTISTHQEYPKQQRQFGNYDLIRRIDMGGMGEVYLAHQRTAFQREVAIKIIREDLSQDPLARARFYREAEVSSRLKHDHILPLFEFGEVDDRLFLVTPYISGGTLAQRLQAGPMSMEEIQQFFSALVQAVAYIHRKGIVHRDLKPGNILLDNDEDSGRVYVRLIDFGIATRSGAEAEPHLTTDGHEIGTIAYMAPERLNGIAAPSNDIYSLGVILYQLLTRRLPVGSAFTRDTIPAALEAVVLGCMAENPHERYATAADVLAAFEQACRSMSPLANAGASLPIILPLSATPSPQVAYAENTVAVPAPRMRRRRSRPLMVMIPSLLIALVLAGIAGIIFIASPLTASASVTLSPQAHAFQYIYTITAQPSQSGIDVANASLPVYQKNDNLTGSQTMQTKQCSQFSFFRCERVVTFSDVEQLTSQLRQSLAPQLAATIDGELLALKTTEIGTKQYTDLSETNTPEIGTPSRSVTVTLTEQASVEYINDTDVQQLTLQLLERGLEPGTRVVNTTLQIGQPVIEELNYSGAVTIKVAVAGVEEYQLSSAQLQALAHHINGMTLSQARAYLQQLSDIDSRSISISIHTLLGGSDTMPANVSQITIHAVALANLPGATLPVVPTPVATLQDDLTSNE